MAPNGDEKAFAVTGKSDRRLLEQTQLGNKGEHGPFCKSKTRGKGQLAHVMIQKTEARRDKGGQASKEEKGERRARHHQNAFKRASEVGACAEVTRDEGGGGTPVPSEVCGEATSAVLLNSRRWLLSASAPDATDLWRAHSVGPRVTS